MIRIVGLSATLPNYTDVAAFLGVNVDTGLFFFDASYRPVPLEMQFVGVTARALHEIRSTMDTIAYNKVWCICLQNCMRLGSLMRNGACCKVGRLGCAQSNSRQGLIRVREYARYHRSGPARDPQHHGHHRLQQGTVAWACTNQEL